MASDDDLQPQFQEAPIPPKDTRVLFLSRKVGEWLKIGDDTYIGVSRTSGQHVRLAISAPDKHVTRLESGENPPGIHDITFEPRPRHRN